MKHGCMVMTLRLNSSRSGSRQIHCGQKKRVKFATVWSPYWSFFSASKALSTRNSYPLVKPSMASFTVRFWSGWGRTFGANVQTSGRKTIGFSIMTMRPLTHHSIDSSRLPKTLQLFPTPPICLTSPPATFSYSPRWNYDWKGVILTWLRRSMQKLKRLSTHSHLITSRDAWNHGKHGGITVYMPEGTTSKKTVWTRVTLWNFFFMVWFPEFLGSPTYMLHLNSY